MRFFNPIKNLLNKKKMPTIYTRDNEEVMTVYKSIEELYVNDLLIETNTYKHWFKKQEVYRDDYESSLSMEEWWNDMGMSETWEERKQQEKQLALCQEKLMWFSPKYEGWCVTPEDREKIFNYKTQ